MALRRGSGTCARFGQYDRKMAVVPANYPAERLVPGEADDFSVLIRQYLHFASDQRAVVTDRSMPRFTQVAYRNGGIIISCQNNYTVAFLEKITSKVHLPAHPDLCLTEPQALDHRFVIHGIVPARYYESSTTFFEAIEEHNVPVKTKYWRVLSSRPVHQGRKVRIDLEVERRTVGLIRRRGFRLEVEPFGIDAFEVAGEVRPSRPIETEPQLPEWDWPELPESYILNRKETASKPVVASTGAVQEVKPASSPSLVAPLVNLEGLRSQEAESVFFNSSSGASTSGIIPNSCGSNEECPTDESDPLEVELLATGVEEQLVDVVERLSTSVTPAKPRVVSIVPVVEEPCTERRQSNHRQTPKGRRQMRPTEFPPNP